MSFRYMKAVKSTDARLLLYGSIITFVSYTFTSFQFLLIPLEVFEPLTLGIIGGSNRLVGLIGAFLFAIGFIKFVGKFLQQKKSHNQI